MRISAYYMIISVFLLLGCSNENGTVSEYDLYGEYLAEYEGGIDRLEIKPDGTYLHEYSDMGSVVEEAGMWRIVGEKSEYADKINMIFIDFKFRKSKYLSNLRGDWSPVATKVQEHKSIYNWFVQSEKKIHLCFQTELQWCFVRH